MTENCDILQDLKKKKMRPVILKVSQKSQAEQHNVHVTYLPCWNMI